MAASESPQEDVKAALIKAYCTSTVITADVSGDIPTLLRHAFLRHFDAVMPLNRDQKSHITQTSGDTLESLLTTLSEIPPLEPAAQVLLDRARSILTSGPPLSMNVELAEGQELPAALHTLNQGAVWACLMGGGANPDLEDRLLTEALWKQPRDTEIHDKIRNALTPEGKCLWFLCRKFFFTMNVAEKDGESYQFNWIERFYHHRMYMGRLFMLHTANHTALTRARMPRALEVYSDWFTHIAGTPKGLWGWGESEHCQLGFRSFEFNHPTRLTFPACPKVAELEASLPPWEKHRMVKGIFTHPVTMFIVTSAGTIMSCAATIAEWFVHSDFPENGGYAQVPLPDEFVPDDIMSNHAVAVMSCGDQQLIAGDNHCGQLGLGHETAVLEYTPIPFHIDRLVGEFGTYNLFAAGDQVLFAGLVPSPLALSGLLPGTVANTSLLTPTPLQFQTHATSLIITWDVAAWVDENGTQIFTDGRMSVPFKSSAVGVEEAEGSCFVQNAMSGAWFEVCGEGHFVMVEEPDCVRCNMWAV
ncbi:hypothetical protein J8273_3000 [Carpediemonas membranifera]|uniref:Uncharacterized protein n=1 Tax=Carpediemonas membranifera TaxID=201153 RepID=A0A8J6B4C1_9EUKA|nr:hypothetical protein J8273_3000 [Carpediemonas membranifera]|eukprot:KAG9395433.1 hypothetical protein J8273_3000 [Carpediemonas membranifera]